ncbi:MAG: anti-sigma factor [Dehalococcoidia bacterium]
MGRELTPRELHELLGAHALDAVEGDEREQLEEWLQRTPDAREELASLRETAALLAHVGAEAPPDVWARIEESLGEEPPPLAVPMHRRRLTMRVTAGLAAASVAAATITAVVLSDEMSRQEERLESVTRSVRERGVEQAAIAAMADARARTLHLESDAGATATVITMPNGEGYLMSVHLPRLEAGSTYQLWALTDGRDRPEMVSAGVLGRDVHIAAFRAPSKAQGFAITLEEAPGSTTPHGVHVLEGSFA